MTIEKSFLDHSNDFATHRLGWRYNKFSLFFFLLLVRLPVYEANNYNQQYKIDTLPVCYYTRILTTGSSVCNCYIIVLTVITNVLSILYTRYCKKREMNGVS